jgi:SAM-dependent methyltransferase
MLNLKRLRRGDLRIDELGPTIYLLSSFAHYGLRALLLPAVKRDVEFVTNEYGQGNRNRTEYWKPTLSADDFIFGNSEDLTWVLIEGKLLRASERAVREHLLPRLKARVAQYSQPGDLIVEYGAGTGRNLAYLARALPDRKYVGLELTPRSVEDARKQLAEINLPVEMHVHDVTQPFAFAQQPAVGYSVLALEQMPRTVSRDAIKQMTTAAKNAVIGFEPIRELYGYSLRGITSRLRQYRADYLGGLPKHVRDLGLRIVVEELSGLAHNPLNEMCELVIETR